MNIKPEIYYIRGQFLVFRNEDALNLRRGRILGHLIGCPYKNPHQLAVGGLPYLISHYSARIAHELDMAVFKELQEKENNDRIVNNTKYSHRVAELGEIARTERVNRRVQELEKRGIDVTVDRIGQFDEDKLKWPLGNLLDQECSNFQAEIIDNSILPRLFQMDHIKMVVFRDLHNRGLYISSGMKFGGDFLVYLGEPVRFHAQFTVRVVTSRDGAIDLKENDYNEFNSLHRVSHTANKMAMFATVSGCPANVKYYTLREREYLSAESDKDSFVPIEPALANLTHIANVAFGPIGYKTEDELTPTKMMKL